MVAIATVTPAATLAVVTTEIPTAVTAVPTTAVSVTSLLFIQQFASRQISVRNAVPDEITRCDGGT